MNKKEKYTHGKPERSHVSQPPQEIEGMLARIVLRADNGGIEIVSIGSRAACREKLLRADWDGARSSVAIRIAAARTQLRGNEG
jgi:hypothetical protein